MTTTLKCIRCNSEIILPDFTPDEKRALLKMKREGLVSAVQRIKDIAHLDLKDAKALVMHINEEYGKCHRCNYKDLKNENAICPKCKAVNTNWIIS